MTTYVVRVDVASESGEPVAEDVIDMAGGRMATRGAAISMAPDMTQLDVLLTGDFDSPADALADGIAVVLDVFRGLGVEMAFQVGTVYTESVFQELGVQSAGG